eukprot:TRINITY_DN833_c0_g1_i1.p1 TRINITY_DN833_c0_g1~~TRINITY_DN833_c0_g1_i1.p1  ORF type:complete len:515 (-),score=97.99 TRINITY_DN833_c0_g1_i1:134-1678(-)
MYESTAVVSDGASFSSVLDSTSDRAYLQFPLHNAPPGSASYTPQSASTFVGMHTPGPPPVLGPGIDFSKRAREADKTQDAGPVSDWDAKRLKLDLFQPNHTNNINGNNIGGHPQYFKTPAPTQESSQSTLASSQLQQGFDGRAPQGMQLEQLQDRYRAAAAAGPSTSTSPFQTGSHLPLDTSFPPISQSTTTTTTSALVYSSGPLPVSAFAAQNSPYFGTPSPRMEWTSSGDSLLPFGCGLSGSQPRGMFSLPSPPKSATAGGLGPFGCSSSLAFPKPMSNEADPVLSIPQRREATSMVDLKQQQQFALQQYQQQQAMQQMQQSQPHQAQPSFQPQQLVSSMRSPYPDARQMAMDAQSTIAGQVSAATTTRAMMGGPSYGVSSSVPAGVVAAVSPSSPSSPRKRISKKKKKDRDALAAAVVLSGEKIDITHLLKLPQSTAAQMLNMSQATFSKRFREANDKRWPYRRLIVLEKQLKTAQSEGDKQTANSLEAAKIQLLGPCFIYKKNEDKKIQH